MNTRKKATQDDIRRAADAAGASEFINALPQGSTPRLAERGSSLSGDQRIALAGRHCAPEQARFSMTPPRR